MKERTQKIIAILSEEFPNPKSELHFTSPFELLVAVILSAQCTDKRVNQVTEQLFQVANTPEKMLELSDATLEQLIYSCGFYKHKAKFLKQASYDIVHKFHGQVPETVEELRTLSGVGRKTANVVYAVWFGGQAIAVDTHVFRVSNRLGLAHAKNVTDTETQLMQEIDRELWSDCHHYILLHGRYVCKSQNPHCNECKLTEYCEYYRTKNEEKHV